jgi:hypothetical protein
LAGASPSLAKGHNNGFGAGAAGPATAGQVDNGQSNNAGSTFGGGGSATSYGQRDQVPDVRADQAAGIHGNSANAQDKSAESGHPSNR